MALTQRSAGQFFAAFYRWNRFAHTSLQTRYTIRTRRNGLRIACISNSRSFTFTRARGSSEESVQPVKEDVKEDGNQALALKQEDRPENLDSNVLAEGLENEGDRAKWKVRDSLRTFMRQVAHPVVIITAAALDAKGNALPVGMSVSSFTTVAMDPPTVSFNIRNPSRTLDAIREDGGCFGAHFMIPTIHAAKIADKFTTGNSIEALGRRRRAVPMSLTDEGKPKAAEIKDTRISAFLECKITQEMTVADHVIVAAEVLKINVKPDRSPVMMYVDGQYVDSKGSQLREHKEMEVRHFRWQTEPGSLFWDLPPTPRHRDRIRLRERIRQYIFHNQQLLNLPLLDAETAIINELRLTRSLLGLRITPLLQSEASKSPEVENQTLGPLDDSLPEFFEFYGPISPDDIKTVIQRAKQLLRNNPLSLQLHYKDFLSYLGVDPRNFTRMTAGDIVAALREENLAEAYHSAPPEDDHVTLEDLERVERQAIEVMRRKQEAVDGIDYVTGMTNTDMAKYIHQKYWVREHLHRVRGRLHVEAAPGHYDHQHIDFAGHLTIEEIRVVVHRIVSWIFYRNKLHTRLFTHTWDILRACRIHPLISGFDTDLFLERIRYYHYMDPSPTEVKRKVVTRIMDRFFSTQALLEDFGNDVTELVRTQPIRAVTWGYLELLTMLGLRHTAVLKIDDIRKSIPADTMLPRLIRSACKERYDTFTSEQRPLVDGFLARSAELERELPANIAKQTSTPAARIRKFRAREHKGENSANVKKAAQLNSSDEFELALRELENSGALGSGAHKEDRGREGNSGGFQAYGLDGGRKTRREISEERFKDD